MAPERLSSHLHADVGVVVVLLVLFRSNFLLSCLSPRVYSLLVMPPVGLDGRHLLVSVRIVRIIVVMSSRSREYRSTEKYTQVQTSQLKLPRRLQNPYNKPLSAVRIQHDRPYD